MPHRRDVLGIGMAVVDTFVRGDDAFLVRNGLPRGGTAFLDRAAFAALMEQAAELGFLAHCPGDNARNMCTAAAALGARATFLGASGNDEIGALFEGELRAAGVEARIERHDGPSGSILAVITPDSERSFALHMGVADRLQRLPEGWPDGFRWLYATSTTLLEPSGTREVVFEAMARAEGAGTKLALSLENAPFLRRSEARLRELLLQHPWALLMGNQEELEVAFGGGGDLVGQALGAAEVAILKRGGQGSTVATREGQRWDVSACPARLVDTTGAGDFFAGAVIARLCQGADPPSAALAGSWVAARVVERVGALLPRDFDPARVPVRWAVGI
ncbi:MAG: PfkB family carbohydrate kinase [Pseudomonadota bacterium]